jgi:hypothetical protein
MEQKIISAGIATVRRFGWMPIVVFLSHEICAHVVDGYRRWPSIDIPLHFAGGVAIAFFISGALTICGNHGVIRRPDWIVHLSAVFGLTCTAAVFWEFAEWTADHTIGTQCQLGLNDTMGDMLNGVLGGIVFIVLLCVRTRRKEAAKQVPPIAGRPGSG